MTARLAPVVIVAAALAVAGCGASGSSSSTPAAAVSTAAPATLSTPSAPPSAPRAHHPRHRPARRASASATASTTSSTSASTSTTPSASVTPEPSPPPPPTTVAAVRRAAAAQRRRIQGSVTGPSPASCLKLAGMAHITSASAGQWQSTDPTGGAKIFVDGPFRSHRDALQDARSLDGVEAAAVGSIYVANAALSDHEQATVQAVARCLSAARGSGGMTF